MVNPTNLSPSELTTKLPGFLKLLQRQPIAHGRQGTIATAVLASYLVTRPMTLLEFRIAIGTTGSAGDTDVDVEVNGVSQAQLTIDNTDADDTQQSTGVFTSAALAVGDIVTVSVTAAPTAGADLDFAVDAEVDLPG